MLANTQMLGTELGFPEVAPAQPAHAPHEEPAAGGGFAAPAAGLGGILGGLSSFLPQISPLVAGGLVPSWPMGGGLVGAVSSFQGGHDAAPSGELSAGTADTLKSAHGS